jgi:hypothetical protein
MVGKSPLWVAKQHGHSIETMLRIYAAWTEGAVDTDLKAIRRAMRHGPGRCKQVEEFASGLNSSPPLPTAADPDPSVGSPQAETNFFTGKFWGARGTSGEFLAVDLAVGIEPRTQAPEF